MLHSVGRAEGAEATMGPVVAAEPTNESGDGGTR